MTSRAGAVSVLVGGFVVAACASGLPSVPGPAPAPEGYLSEAALVRLAQTVPAAPDRASPVDLADRAASARFASLEDTDRWLLATAHAELRPPLALQHFDCALGVRLAAAKTPRLDRIMARIFHDADDVAERVKARAARLRPVGDDPDRRACQRLTEAARKSPSYPSGGAAVATAYAEAFAVIAPDRAAAVRRIGHEIGVSRLVCAMHYPSDVAAGEAVGRAVVAEVAARSEFPAEARAARAEIAAARATGLTNPGCAAERAALATPVP